MEIRYFDPLTRAYGRMKKALFQHFNLRKWFVVGFTAFLAGLTDCHGGNGGGGGRWNQGDAHWHDVIYFPQYAYEWLLDHPHWFSLIVFGVIVIFLLGILLTWLSSRGKFMFLDNVVHNRAEIARPWRDFRKEGDSLFLWRLVFGIAAFAIFAAFTVFFFVGARRLYDSGFDRSAPILFLVGMGLTFFVLLIVIGYISLFLNDFVVPIMVKDRISTVAGWRRFLPLLGHHPFSFIFFGLIIFALYLLFVVLVIFAGLITCCIGWLILVIPYIGTVVTLPVWYTLRAFSLEFLAQFGPEYRLFPAPEERAAAD